MEIDQTPPSSDKPPSETKPNWKKWALTIVVVALLSSIAILIVTLSTSNKQPEQIACTQDAKLCPDGSYVGRTGPNCEFSQCPTTNASSSAETDNWKTYTNTKAGYSLQYPPDIIIDATNEDAISFYREGVPTTGGGQGLGHGMVIYYRNFGAETVESQSRPKETISVAGNQAIRWTDNNSCTEDIWMPSPNGNNTLRISFTTCAEKSPFQETDLKLFDQILSTFKFNQ